MEKIEKIEKIENIENNNVMTLNEWQNTFKEPKTLIVQGSVKNGKDEWQDFPIGMCYGYMMCDFNSISLQIGNHSKTVLCAIVESTDTRRRGNFSINRKIILQNLKNNSINNIKLSITDYFEKLPDYKFVISPEGNGIDCHRHYEALIAGCIPIIERNPLTEEKYKGLPILYTTDYTEINEEYLNKVYEEMKEVSYDFSRLFLSFYTEEQRQMIYDCGNYWTERWTKKKFY